MSHFNSQEQTIYRSLAGQIQLGFFDDGERFPSVQDIARRYQVSSCPAQRALKALEREGLVKLCRGKPTVVLKKPYQDYLKSPVFQRRIAALADLFKTLKLISSSICFQGLCCMERPIPAGPLAEEQTCTDQVKCLYRLFDQAIQALGSRIVRSLYYDIGAFAGSAFQDILYAMYGDEKAERYWKRLFQCLLESLRDCQEHRYDAGKKRLENIEHAFYDDLEQYLDGLRAACEDDKQISFSWEPHKGRARYYDAVAIDLIRKIGQGVYPAGAYLPNGAVLADIYHVSEMTVRRTIALLNKLGVVKTRNGLGTCVVGVDTSVSGKIKSLMMDENFITFLEALQLLAITGESVVFDTFPRCSAESLDAIARAVSIKEQNASVVATISACLQAVVHHAPLAAVREIYGKITLLLLDGSVLQFNQIGGEPALDCAGILQTLAESLKTGDGRRFAAAFRELVHINFALMRKKLLETGVAGVDAIKLPRRI
ncbi:GntR family transcriptional regulator [Candidatus Soleaferrea massiliensis]|uniref:GntR family transcriptional regulator n=1 Tax=Candidatus Soleaferrea massiliensis TaxID=1470354 RepID=UPI0005915051|nr:GntR family transcriptional regulator [Candidatus Soleaferrea massiliensis]